MVRMTFRNPRAASAAIARCAAVGCFSPSSRSWSFGSNTLGATVVARRASWQVRQEDRSSLPPSRTCSDTSVPGRDRTFRRGVLPACESNQASLPNRWESSLPWKPPNPQEQSRRQDWPESRMLAAIIHKFGVSVDFLRKFRAESVFRCDYKASKLVEPNRDEARAPSGNSSARRGLYICVGAGSQGTVRWDTDGASVMRRAFVRDKTMPGAPRCDEKFPEPGHRF